MKPYEVEIFDRNFNYRANALVNPEAVKWQRDLLTSVSNTLTLENTNITIRTNASSGSTGDQTVGLSDYIRIIKSNGGTYSGLIKKLEKEENNNIVITYVDVFTLFNHEIYINSVETTRTAIETLLKNWLTEEFKESADDSQIIPGLEITIHTSTLCLFDFVDNENPYVTINLLTDIIFPAFQKYLVLTTAVFDIVNKKIVVNIGRMSTTSVRTIELDLPNIIDKNVVIRSSSNELNKLIIIDNSEDPYLSYRYYLHTDYTVDSDKSTNRMLPVVNAVKAVNIDTLAEHAYWRYEKQYLLTAADLIEMDGALSSSQLSQLSASVDFVKDYIYGNRNTSSFNYYHDFAQRYVNWILKYCPDSPFINDNYYYWDGSESVNIMEDIQEQGEGYFYSRAQLLTEGSNCGYDVSENKGTADYVYYLYDTIPTTTGVISTGIHGRHDANCQYHAVIKQVLKIELFITIRGNDSVPTKYTFYVTTWSGLTRDEYEAALDSYKQTSGYHSDIESYKLHHIDDILTEYAESVFNTSKYKNLIEMVTTADDGTAESLNYGNTVDIIYKGKTYKSVLTGFTDMGNGLYKLTFGMIRLELTKILKMERQG